VVPPSANTLLYTVPAGAAVVIRDVVIDNTDASPNPGILYVAAGSLNYVLWRGSVPASTSVHLDLRQRLEPGDQLYCANSLPDVGPLGIVVTGYVFR
jgi:hypothetical protein